MNREILFRGKRIDNGKWVEGYVSKPHHRNNGKIEGYYFNALDELGWVAECAVSAETVCQYTGLTDKDDRKIFEGDIVRYTDEVIGKEKIDEVEYNETLAAFCRLHKSEMGLQYLFIDECIANKCEVIGNIYDNPELLEGGRS